MSVRPSDVDRVWSKLGFDIDDGKKRDIWATLVVNGKIVVQTKRSRGAKGTAGQIPTFIRQQMKLSRDEFHAAIACPLTRDDYHALLREKGLIGPP